MDRFTKVSVARPTWMTILALIFECRLQEVRPVPLSTFSCISAHTEIGDNNRAFVQFTRIEHAISFMDKNHPKIQLESLLGSTPSVQARDAVYIHFARSRNGQEVRYPVNDAQWLCSNVCPMLCPR